MDEVKWGSKEDIRELRDAITEALVFEKPSPKLQREINEARKKWRERVYENRN